MSIVLSRIAVGLPTRTELVDDVLRRVGATSATRRLFTQVYKLHRSPVLGPGERLEDLLVDVGRRALNGDRARLILYGHTVLLQEVCAEPGFANRMREALNLPGVPFFGLSYVACTSVLRAVEVARRYLQRPDAPTHDGVLVLGGDHSGSIDHARIVPRMTVQGDGAIGLLVRRDAGRYRYLGGAVRRDPRFHRGLRLDAEGIRLFGLACIDHLLAALGSALDSAGLTMDDIDWVMPHLSNAMLWRTFSRASGIPLDRFCLDLIPEQGHIYGLDALAALEHADRTGRLSPGQRCALLAIGVGAYFQVTIVEVTED